MTVTAKDLKEKILASITQTLSVEKTYDEVGHRFRHERFAITFDLPKILRLGSHGFKGHTVDIDSAEIETPKKEGE